MGAKDEVRSLGRWQGKLPVLGLKGCVFTKQHSLELRIGVKITSEE